MKKGRSIRAKLAGGFVTASVLIFVVNMYIYLNQNEMVGRIDNVYSHNIQLNELSETLKDMQDALYQYLNTKSSAELERYYTFEQEYDGLLDKLNTRTVSDANQLMEKNICNMSETYLEQTRQAVAAKRGRNVSGYNEYYNNAKQVYDFLQSCIQSTNNMAFLKNSRDYTMLRDTLNVLVWCGLFIQLAVILAAIIWIVYVTGSITKPLIKLANAADEIARGNMEVDFPMVETEDEISTVAKACNKMIENIRTYIQKTKENYERENRLVERELSMKNDLKEAQLKYLQAQINPHFLFNSLNAGSQLAMMEGAERACMFLENMADFFRYNVRKMDQDTTLREELDLVDNYIYILNVRFSGDIHYDRQIDERYLNVYMPGMVIQPLIENAVNHGIREMEGEGRIQLSVYGHGDLICIKVTDNGKGIDPETAEKIMRGESVHEDEGDTTGIGLDNVRNRLQGYYNMERVMEIRRTGACGTEVTLYIRKEWEMK